MALLSSLINKGPPFFPFCRCEHRSSDYDWDESSCASSWVLVILWSHSRCSYLLSSCWVDQCRVRTIKMPLTLLCLYSTVQCTHLIFFAVCVYLYFSSCIHVNMCNNNLRVKLTFLYYVNLTYESMSMRAGLIYKGIAYVFYQHTWIWHTCIVCYLRGQSNDTRTRVKITHLFLQCSWLVVMLSNFFIQRSC